MHALGIAILLFATAADTAQTSEFKIFRGLQEQQEAVNVLNFAPRVQTAQPFAAPNRNPQANEPRYYACPKDGAMLRVPVASGGATFKCPVDGTVMSEGVGPSKKIFLLDQQ